METYKATVWSGSRCLHKECKTINLELALAHFKNFGEVISVYLGTPGQPDYVSTTFLN